MFTFKKLLEIAPPPHNYSFGTQKLKTNIYLNCSFHFIHVPISVTLNPIDKL